MAELNAIQRRLVKPMLEESQLLFTRYFFKLTEQSSFIVNKHHKVMADTLDKVFRGEITRLVINVPPGYTKTLMAVIMFIARGLAVNPKSKFIHLSYSDSLAMLNSTLIRDIVRLPEYQEMWPIDLHPDRNSKKAWYNTWGGGLYATSTAGQVTGFRGGRVADFEGQFTGALIIDDPLKMEDAYSETIRERINNRFTNTIKSRLMHEDIPIIVIGQRAHVDDMSAFLLNGGSGESWHHLHLPVVVGECDMPKFPHQVQIRHTLPDGPLWDYKHNPQEIEVLKSADPYTYSSQYMQEPTILGGSIFKEDYWKYYTELPSRVELVRLYIDTAQKTGEHNDYSVIQAWAYAAGHIYLVDQVRGKYEAPELEIIVREFWSKHRQPQTIDGHHCEIPRYYPGASMMLVEDKSSGSSLIQYLQRKTQIPVMPIERDKDKVQRAMGAVPYCSSGLVHLPYNADFLVEFVEEMSAFTPVFTHKHDDQVDVCMSAIEDLLGTGVMSYAAWA